MTKIPTFYFGAFKLRPAIIADFDRAVAWNAAEPRHSDRTGGEFWIEQTMTSNSFVLEDNRGTVFYFKMTMQSKTEIWINIQFGPIAEVGRHRVMDGLIQGFAWLQKELLRIGYKVIYFNSKDQGLIYFCQRKIGFVWDGQKLVRRLEDGTDNPSTEKPSEQRLCSPRA